MIDERRTYSPVRGGRWLARRCGTADPAVRMFCFPHAGGGGAAFNSWAGLLPPQVELSTVRFPGRENRLAEPLLDDPGILLERLEAVLAPLLDRPFVLLGHCSGSVLAFELARRLRAVGGAAPAMLVVSSSEAPRLRTVTDPLHQLPRDELLRRVIEFGGMAAAVLDDPDLMRIFERVLRADYRVVESVVHAAEPPLDVPITVIGGRNDTFVGCDELVAWSSETVRGFALHLLEAGHFVLDAAGPVVGNLLQGLVEPA